MSYNSHRKRGGTFHLDGDTNEANGQDAQFVTPYYDESNMPDLGAPGYLPTLESLDTSSSSGESQGGSDNQNVADNRKSNNLPTNSTNDDKSGRKGGPLVVKKGLEEASQSMNRNQNREDEEERMAADAEKRKRLLLSNNLAANTPAEATRRVKLLMLGDSGVGKSSLIMRWTLDTFSPSLQSTVGVNFKSRKVHVANELMQVQVWDTVGQEQFHKITTSYYKGAQGIMLVYDVTDPASLANIEYWIKNIKHHTSDQVQVALIGNKTDLRASETDPTKKCCETEHGQKIAGKYGIPFFETSAKDSFNVEIAFLTLVEHIADGGGSGSASHSPGSAPGAAAAGAGTSEMEQYGSSPSGVEERKSIVEKEEKSRFLGFFKGKSSSSSGKSPPPIPPVTSGGAGIACVEEPPLGADVLSSDAPKDGDGYDMKEEDEEGLDALSEQSQAWRAVGAVEQPVLSCSTPSKAPSSPAHPHAPPTTSKSSQVFSSEAPISASSLAAEECTESSASLISPGSPGNPYRSTGMPSSVAPLADSSPEPAVLHAQFNALLKISTDESLYSPVGELSPMGDSSPFDAAERTSEDICQRTSVDVTSDNREEETLLKAQRSEADGVPLPVDVDQTREKSRLSCSSPLPLPREQLRDHLPRAPLTPMQPSPLSASLNETTLATSGTPITVPGHEPQSAPASHTAPAVAVSATSPVVRSPSQFQILCGGFDDLVASVGNHIKQSSDENVRDNEISKGVEYSSPVGNTTLQPRTPPMFNEAVEPKENSAEKYLSPAPISPTHGGGKYADLRDVDTESDEALASPSLSSPMATNNGGWQPVELQWNWDEMSCDDEGDDNDHDNEECGNDARQSSIVSPFFDEGLSIMTAALNAAFKTGRGHHTWRSAVDGKVRVDCGSKHCTATIALSHKAGSASAHNFLRHWTRKHCPKGYFDRIIDHVRRLKTENLRQVIVAAKEGMITRSQAAKSEYMKRTVGPDHHVSFDDDHNKLTLIPNVAENRAELESCGENYDELMVAEKDECAGPKFAAMCDLNLYAKPLDTTVTGLMMSDVYGEKGMDYNKYYEYLDSADNPGKLPTDIVPTPVPGPKFISTAEALELRTRFTSRLNELKDSRGLGYRDLLKMVVTDVLYKGTKDSYNHVDPMLGLLREYKHMNVKTARRIEHIIDALCRIPASI